jgi:hypothetical protein
MLVALCKNRGGNCIRGHKAQIQIQIHLMRRGKCNNAVYRQSIRGAEFFPRDTGSLISLALLGEDAAVLTTSTYIHTGEENLTPILYIFRVHMVIWWFCSLVVALYIR